MPAIILKLMLPSIGFFILLLFYFYISGKLKNKISKLTAYIFSLLVLIIVCSSIFSIFFALNGSLGMQLLEYKESWARNFRDSLGIGWMFFHFYFFVFILLVSFLRIREFKRNLKFKETIQNISNIDAKPLKTHRSIFEILLIVVIILFSMGILLETMGTFQIAIINSSDKVVDAEIEKSKTHIFVLDLNENVRTLGKYRGIYGVYPKDLKSTELQFALVDQYDKDIYYKVSSDLMSYDMRGLGKDSLYGTADDYVVDIDLAKKSKFEETLITPKAAILMLERGVYFWQGSMSRGGEQVWGIGINVDGQIIGNGLKRVNIYTEGDYLVIQGSFGNKMRYDTAYYIDPNGKLADTDMLR